LQWRPEYKQHKWAMAMEEVRHEKNSFFHKWEWETWSTQVTLGSQFLNRKQQNYDFVTSQDWWRRV
jgi:hypothetical protein